jgi:hypothetical protein
LGAIAGRQFDAIVVSGDLTQRAERHEYAALDAFARHSLLPRLKREEARRIIFVPGNHDVSWGHSKLAFSPLQRALEHKELSEYQRNPDLSRLRLDLGPTGGVQWFEKRSQEAYVLRFLEFQRFQDGFYGKQPSEQNGSDRSFDLLSFNGDADFSAHVFDAEQMVFYGFNSCFANDSFWHGAHIAPNAITQARKHALGLPKDYLKVAVWHHGIEGERTRPDRLPLTEIAQLRAAGFRVGFHGHVHNSSFDVRDFLSSRFVIVSTGSLGAASEDRPDAVGNQFSIVRLLPTSVGVDLYELDEREQVYCLKGTARRKTYFIPDDLDAHKGASAKHVLRTLRLDGHGIAEVEVVLKDVSFDGPITLAAPSGSLSNCQHDEDAFVDGQDPVRVSETPSEDGSFRYQIIMDRGGASSKVQWKFRVANAFALNSEETQLFPQRRAEVGWDVWSHLVSIDTDSLTLELDFPEGNSPPTEVRSRVERPRIEQGKVRWERVPSEELRCKKGIVGSRLTLEVAAPMQSYSYGLEFRLAAGGLAPSQDAVLAMNDVLGRCLDSVQGAEELRGSLRTVVQRALALSLGGESQAIQDWSEEGIIFSLMLWDHSRRVLRPVAGFFPPVGWTTEFRHGAGVAGHSFRFGAPAAWSHERGVKRSLVKVPARPGHQDYDWIICCPLMEKFGGASVGVVSVAARDTNSDLKQRLKSHAREAAPNEPGQLLTATYELNVGFWSLAQHAKISAVVARVGHEAVKSWPAPAETSRKPTTSELRPPPPDND